MLQAELRVGVSEILVGWWQTQLESEGRAGVLLYSDGSGGTNWL